MITDELFEKCLRALYFAPQDKPSLALLRDMSSVAEDGFRAALAIAFEAGRKNITNRMVPMNGCRWCGVVAPEHYNRYDQIHGWHQWQDPGDEVRKARLLANRSLVAEAEVNR